VYFSLNFGISITGKPAKVIATVELVCKLLITVIQWI